MMAVETRFNFFFTLDNRYTFEIPPFQRGYSWNSKRVSEFMNDLKRIDADSQSSHFFGTIYTSKNKNPNKPHHLRIVDGQQRITTAAIFLICCRDYFDTLQNDSMQAKGFFDRVQQLLYKLRQDTDSPDENRFILVPNRTNKQFFNNYILPRKPPCEKLKAGDSVENDSDEFLLDAYRVIYRYIESYAPDISKIKKINHMIWTLLEQGKLIRIDVDDEAEAYLMFDLINNRGVQLTQSDLVKNKLFGQLSCDLNYTDLEHRIDEYDAKWASMRDNITGKTTGSTTLDNFFLQYLIAFHLERRLFVDPQITSNLPHRRRSANILQSKNLKKKDIFCTFDGLLNSRQPTSMIHDLQDWSRKFAGLRQPEKHFNLYPDAYHYLKKINAINAINVYAVLLSGYKNYWENDYKVSFVKLTKLCFVYHIRAKSLRAGIVLENYETRLSQLAFRLNQLPAPSIRDLVGDIIADEKAYPTDAKIKPHLEALKPQNNNLSMALLEEIERTIDPDKVSSSDATVEHIMPKNTEHWISYIIENHSDIHNEDDVEMMHKKYYNLLGNQTLLRLPKNSRVSNREFDYKKNVYKDDGHNITKELKSVNRWTKKTIDARQKKFSKMLLDLLDLSNFLRD